MNVNYNTNGWVKCSIILLMVLLISGCGSARWVNEHETIMSMANQGQFDQAVRSAKDYADIYLKEKNYKQALLFLGLRSEYLYKEGNYEKVIKSYDSIENVYKQILQKHGNKKPTDLLNPTSRYLYQIYLNIDSSIQLGEYKSALAMIDKAEKEHSQFQLNGEKLLSGLRWLMSEDKLKREEEASYTNEIIFLYYKILTLNALGKKSKSVELWEEFKSKCPVPKTIFGITPVCSLIYNMSTTAWLVDDGNFLLHGGKILKEYEFPKEFIEMLNTLQPHDPLYGSTFIYQKKSAILRGIFYEAEGLRLTGKYREAVDAYLNYLSMPEVKSQGTYLWKAYDGLGKAYEALEEKEKASHAYLEAIKIIESERQFLSKDSYKRNFLLHRDHPYDRAVILLAERDPEKSFHVAEQGKSRALLDLLEGRPVGRTLEARQTNNLISKQGRKLQASNSITRTNTDRIPQPHLQTTRATMQQAKRELKRTDMELLSMINAQAETYADFKPLLTSDTAVIEYYLTPEQGVAFVGMEEELHALPIHMKEDDIRNLVRQFVNRIVAKDRESALHDAGNRLFNAVLAPALNHIARHHNPITRLLIVPHGPLHFLPFSALSYGNQWMIEKYEIVQLPSASVLRFCRNKSVHDYQNILAFGNPTIAKKVPQLPAAQLEVQTIGQLFGQKAKIVMKENAKETLFRSEGFKFDIVHFACHADFDSKSPSRSALLLSADTQNDGRLEVWEIMQTPLEASFVAMSACNTSKGAISSGDEVVGLSRGMLYAGTPSLLGSLWSIDDKATSILMASFYKGLLAGKRPTTALRNAQLKMMLQSSEISIYRRPMKTGEREHQPSSPSRYSHPFFWAAFNIIGDWK